MAILIAVISGFALGVGATSFYAIEHASRKCANGELKRIRKIDRSIIRINSLIP